MRRTPRALGGLKARPSASVLSAEVQTSAPSSSAARAQQESVHTAISARRWRACWTATLVVPGARPGARASARHFRLRVRQHGGTIKLVPLHALRRPGPLQRFFPQQHALWPQHWRYFSANSLFCKHTMAHSWMSAHQGSALRRCGAVKTLSPNQQAPPRHVHQQNNRASTS